jgi:hypothetical protein
MAKDLHKKMREETGIDIWSKTGEGFIGVLTNLVVKSNGRLVMAAGQAKEALERYPDIDLLFGDFVNRGEHNFQLLVVNNEEYPMIFNFPTKYHWSYRSDLVLIRKNAEFLAVVARQCYENKFFLPRPGCGLGGLRWEEVKRVIERILPDNVIIVTK